MISNVTATAIGGNIAGIIWGLPEAAMTNITMYNVNIAAPTKTFCIYDANGIRIINSNLTAPTTSTTNALTLYNVGITVTNSALNTNLVTFGGLSVPGTNTLAFFNAQAAVATSNVLGSASTITGSAGSLTLSGSAMAFNQSGFQIFDTNIVITSASTFTFSGGTNVLSGALIGPGPLALNLASSMLNVQGVLTGFTGTLTITNGGTLSFNQAGNTWGDSNATLDASSSGIVNNHSVANVAVALGALAGGPGSRLQGSDQSGSAVDTYVVGGLNTNTTFAGFASDGTGGTPHTVALTKVGTGIFTVSGASSYSGGTTVSNGTLLVNNATGSGTGAGAVTVVSAAALGGTGVIAGPMTVDGTLAPGNSLGTLTVSNNLVVDSGAVLQYQLGTNSDLTVVSGNLTLSGTLNIIDAGGFTNATYTLFTYGGALTYNGVTIGTTPNPAFNYMIDTNTVGVVNLDVTGSAPPPTAGFTATPTSGGLPLGVTFTDTSTGSITNIFWNFGDGGTTNTSVGAGFVYTYANVGTYSVTLIASGPGGDGTNIQPNLITALDPFVAWQLQYFGCTNVAICPQAAPDADPLGKGMSNTNQFLAGLNPTNAASALQITSAVRLGADVLITWTTAGAHTNAVQATAGDGNGGYVTNFTDLSGPIVITGSGDVATNYMDIGGATNTPSRFYRVRLVP